MLSHTLKNVRLHFEECFSRSRINLLCIAISSTLWRVTLWNWRATLSSSSTSTVNLRCVPLRSKARTSGHARLRVAARKASRCVEYLFRALFKVLLFKYKCYSSKCYSSKCYSSLQTLWRITLEGITLEGITLWRVTLWRKGNALQRNTLKRNPWRVLTLKSVHFCNFRFCRAALLYDWCGLNQQSAFNRRGGSRVMLCNLAVLHPCYLSPP